MLSAANHQRRHKTIASSWRRIDNL